MSAGKLIKIYGARAKIEATYNAPSSPANADGILLAGNPDLKISYANDGVRAMPAGNTGTNLRVPPSGRVGETTLKFEVRGAAAAYSATVLPNIHAILRACGLDAAVTVTATLESVLYTATPGPTGYSSVSADLFSRGQQYAMTGIFGDLTLGAAGPVVPSLDVAIKGLVTAITDASVPALVYGIAPLTQTIIPPKSTNITLNFNGISTLKVKNWQFKMNRTMGARLDQNAGGHAGWSIGSRAPTLELEVENPPSGTIDFYALRDAGTVLSALQLNIGSVQYNKYFFRGYGAQVVEVSDAAEDPTATVKVKVQLSTQSTGVDFDMTFN